MRVIKECFWCRSKNLKRFTRRIDDKPVSECRDCGLLLVTNLPDDLSEYYQDEEYFNPTVETKTGYHENYNHISPLYLYWQGSLINEVARATKARTLLEVGCATGNALEMIHARNADLKLTGIDLSPYGIEICKAKGLVAEISTINNYARRKNTYDIVFSSETMEHVDDLREFVESSKDLVGEAGVYVFYVPAVVKSEMAKQRKNYISLTTSLEHVSYFTSDFLVQAMEEVFGNVTLAQMSTEGEDYIIGVASKDRALIDNIGVFIQGLREHNSRVSSPETLFNLSVITSKFALFNFADKYVSKLAKSEKDQRITNLARGIIAFNKGELENASNFFIGYLEKMQVADLLVYKLMHANEKELNKLYSNKIAELSRKVEGNQSIEQRLYRAENELLDLKNSKIVGYSIALRKRVGRIFKKLKSQKKNIIPKTKSIIIKALPVSKRETIFRLAKRLKYKIVKVKNTKLEHGQVLCSVVITYFNKGDTIDETIYSLNQQTLKNFEIIIVDDGSTDAYSRAKLKDIREKYPHIKILSQKNSGVANARNNGISIAEGRYIMSLDSDDAIEPTCLEKMAIFLETRPGIVLATTDMYMFGVENGIYKEAEYDPLELINNNMVIVASMFRKSAWSAVGGYTPGIGYEDWEFWIKMAEKGLWGKRIPEVLFKYRTAISSRYIDDKAKHKKNYAIIRKLHPGYETIVKQMFHRIRRVIYIARPDTSFINLSQDNLYVNSNKPKVMIVVPWMTFGGAETLINNFCQEIYQNFDLTFVTGLDSENEWEYKFQVFTSRIYHLSNLFEDDNNKLEFISNYIKTRDIKILHIIHNGFMFKMLPELKSRHPRLRVIVTMFNDRVEYFSQSTRYSQFVDIYTSDNRKVQDHYNKLISNNSKTIRIPNGIDTDNTFNPNLYDRQSIRKRLGIHEADIACFFIGRLSEEKNPDVFVRVAEDIIRDKDHKNLRFYVIGDGPMNKEVVGAINKIKSERVQYLGYKAEVAEYLSAADVFILPSSIEGFPLSLLEAMAMGLVSIASDVGAVSEVIKNNETGYVINPGSVDDITNTLKKITNNPRVLKTMGTKARKEAVDKYSSKQLGKNYRKLYEKVME